MSQCLTAKHKGRTRAGRKLAYASMSFELLSSGEAGPSQRWNEVVAALRGTATHAKPSRLLTAMSTLRPVSSHGATPRALNLTIGTFALVTGVT